MIRCLRVIARHRTVQKTPYRLVVISTRQMALILSIRLDTDLMEALMLRCVSVQDDHLPGNLEKLENLKRVREMSENYEKLGEIQKTEKDVSRGK